MNDDHLRMSDAEREEAAAELGEHYAQGRLDHAEHAERLDRVWAARTHGDLAPVFRDLPGHRRAPARPWAGARPATAWRRGLPTPVVVVLGVLLVVTVLTHLPVIVLGLLLWLVVSSRGHRRDARRQPAAGGRQAPWRSSGR